jgi:hypothetical protein
MILMTSLLLALASPAYEEPVLPSAEEALHAVFDSTLYFGAGSLIASGAALGGIGWAVCQLTPWASTVGNECLIASRICGILSLHAFTHAIKSSPLLSFFFKKVPSSHSAWNLNKKLLSQIPTFSAEESELLDFLKRRWLAKMTGVYPLSADWICPSFGISFQVHPESTNSYGRDPATKSSATYTKRIESWKNILPHPEKFPLILTRPSSILDKFPLCLEMPKEENKELFFERLASMIDPGNDDPVIVDLTSVLPDGATDRQCWQDAWHSYESGLSKSLAEQGLDLDRVLCIHRVQQKNVGGIRVLPFVSSSKENVEKHYHFILEWVSRFGLSANRIELDRCVLSSKTKAPSAPIQKECASKEQWLSFLDSIEKKWTSAHPQKNLMFKGTVQVLRALCTVLSQEKWESILNSPTRAAVVQVCFAKIKHQFDLLIQEEETVSFHEMTSHIEQIHADLTSLLEIFKPFTSEEFPDIYRRHLTSIPQDLQPLTGYALHSSAMTSLMGIFKAAERTLGRAPRILYGENIYFECVHACERISHPKSTEEATEQDWKEVDLILAQFNPPVKRINFKVTEYQVTQYHLEKIAETLHRALEGREGRPLFLALDSTLDYSDSPRTGALLAAFQKEIENGDLIILCYRSGLKFDLFGMDNYCGAPFFMLHNKDAKWSFFDALLTDPALKTDPLSFSWFCLAFEHAAPFLEEYRKHIFDNTRAVLDKLPAKLFHEENTNYRVIPIDTDVDASFIDIKIFGPLHTFRGNFLVGIYLTVTCAEAGYPLLLRPGIGFFHPNHAVLFGEECTTVRLTVGLDPAQVDVIVRCMEKVADSVPDRKL